MKKKSVSTLSGSFDKWSFDYKDSILYKGLEAKDPKRQLSNILDAVYGFSKDLLERIAASFPDFTPHGIGHIDRVIRNLCDLIPTDVIEEMSAEHLFILLSATILHDIGMAASDTSDIDEIAAALKIKQSPSLDLAAIREEHHERSAEWILRSRHLEEMGFRGLKNGTGLKKAIALVAKAHRKIPLASIEFEKMSHETGIHSLSFLGAALRLADEMDITVDRISWIANRPKLLDTMMDKQREAFLTHSIVKDWRISRRGEIVTLHADVDDIVSEGVTLIRSSEVLLILDALTRKLKKTVQETGIIPWKSEQYAFPIELQLHTIVTDPKLGPSIRPNILTKADAPSVVEYLTKALYRDHNSVIRELVSNGIDACGPLGVSEEYSPLVTVKLKVLEKPAEWMPVHDDRCIVLEVSDNGIGMNQGVLVNHCLVLGSSYMQSPHYLESLKERGILATHHTAIGRFGIGLFSSLSMSEVVQIETVPFEDPKTEFVARLSQYLSPVFKRRSTMDDIPHGTRVTIPFDYGYMHSDRFGYWDLCDYLKSTFVRPRSNLSIEAFHDNIEIPMVESTFISEEREFPENLIDSALCIRRGYKGTNLEIELEFFFGRWTTVLAWLTTQNVIRPKWSLGNWLSRRKEWWRALTRTIDKTENLQDILPNGFTKLTKRSVDECLEWTESNMNELKILREGIRFENVKDYHAFRWHQWAWPFTWLLGTISDGWIDFDASIVDIDLSRHTLFLENSGIQELHTALTEIACDVCDWLLKNRSEKAHLWVESLLPDALIACIQNGKEVGGFETLVEPSTSVIDLGFSFKRKWKHKKYYWKENRYEFIPLSERIIDLIKQLKSTYPERTDHIKL